MWFFFFVLGLFQFLLFVVGALLFLQFQGELQKELFEKLNALQVKLLQALQPKDVVKSDAESNESDAPEPKAYLTPMVQRTWTSEEIKLKGKPVSISYQYENGHFYLKVDRSIAKFSVEKNMSLGFSVQTEDAQTRKSRFWMDDTEIKEYVAALLQENKVLCPTSEGARQDPRIEWLNLLPRIRINLERFPQSKKVVMDQTQKINVCLTSTDKVYFLYVETGETDLKFLVNEAGMLFELDDEYDFQKVGVSEVLIYLFTQLEKTNCFWSLQAVKTEPTESKGVVDVSK